MTKAANLAALSSGPAFSAYQSAPTAIANGVTTKVAFDGKFFDTGNRFNNTASTVNGIPAYSFMPDVAGYYLVGVNVQYQGAAYTGVFATKLYKNNTQWEELFVATATGTYIRGNTTTLLYLNGTTDYIAAFAYHVQGASQNMVGTSFSAALIRAA